MHAKIAVATVATLVATVLSPAYAASTHLMQPAISSHVMLVDRPFIGGSASCLAAGFKDRAFFRVFPDGTLSPEPFQIPKEQHLVITDVEWSGVGLGAASLTPGYTLRLEISLATLSSYIRVFQSRGINLDADSATGRPGSSEQLTAGFVVGSGVSICPQVDQLQPTSVIAAQPEHIVLRGYLVPVNP